MEDPTFSRVLLLCLLLIALFALIAAYGGA